MTEWQPIVSAPTDGTPMLASFGTMLGPPSHGTVDVRQIKFSDGRWLAYSRFKNRWESILDFPVYWIPMPTLPVQQS